MFRRKTDQVYATLQQVQRRITEQADASASLSSSSSPPLYPFATPAGSAHADGATGHPTPPQPSSPSPLHSPFRIPTPLPFNAVPAADHETPTKGHVLTLTGEVAMTLAIVWLITIAIAFAVGRSQGTRAPIDPGAGYAAGDAGHRSVPQAGGTPATSATPAPAKPTAAVAGTTTQRVAGGHVLVLQSVARASADDEQRFGRNAQNLNTFAEQHPQHGYHPWFGMRRTSNGGLQLVYGVVDGQFGIDKDQFSDLAEAMNRAGYKGAHWFSIK